MVDGVPLNQKNDEKDILYSRGIRYPVFWQDVVTALTFRVSMWKLI